MPTLDCYVVTSPGTSLFSFEIGTDGIFLFITPLQFALLWPWTKV